MLLPQLITSAFLLAAGFSGCAAISMEEVRAAAELEANDDKVKTIAQQPEQESMQKWWDWVTGVETQRLFGYAVNVEPGWYEKKREWRLHNGWSYWRHKQNRDAQGNNNEEWASSARPDVTTDVDADKPSSVKPSSNGSKPGSNTSKPETPGQNITSENVIPYVFWLQKANFENLKDVPAQMLMVDPHDSELTTNEIKQLHAQGKKVIAYISVGEAEDYREYWQSGWKSGNPSWILKENPLWKGNYRVDYREPQWQKIIITEAKRLATMGYDGLLMDVVEAYDTLHSERGVAMTQAQQGMVTFVKAIADGTRAINPNMQLWPNGGVELLASDEYIRVITGQVKEDTYYNEQGRINAPWVEADLALLSRLKRVGKPVYMVDYVANNTTQQKDFFAKSEALGYVPYIGTRQLDKVLSVNETHFKSKK